MVFLNIDYEMKKSTLKEKVQQSAISQSPMMSSYITYSKKSSNLDVYHGFPPSNNEEDDQSNITNMFNGWETLKKVLVLYGVFLFLSTVWCFTVSVMILAGWEPIGDADVYDHLVLLGAVWILGMWELCMLLYMSHIYKQVKDQRIKKVLKVKQLICYWLTPSLLQVILGYYLSTFIFFMSLSGLSITITVLFYVYKTKRSITKIRDRKS